MDSYTIFLAEWYSIRLEMAIITKIANTKNTITATTTAEYCMIASVDWDKIWLNFANEAIEGWNFIEHRFIYLK